MKERIYAFRRVSTAHQNIERQDRNILERYPNAIVVREYYTGTKLEGRTEWNKLYNQVKKDIYNDINATVVFDEVTRMSRNEIEGFNLYQELFDLGVNLVFLKDQHINTDVYRKALSIEIPMTNSNVDILLKAIKEYLMAVAKEQIRIAFEQAEKEVRYLHKRTSEELLTAKLNGKQIGRVAGKKYKTTKDKL